MNKTILFIVCLYVTLSFWEWFLHKYIMHSKKGQMFYNDKYGGEHISHHEEVNNDGSIKFRKDPKGLIFQWITLIPMGIIIFISLYFINKLGKFKLSYKTLIIIVIVCGIAYGMLWNTLHQKFHYVHLDYPTSKGFPCISELYNNESIALHWLWKNHMIHHLQKGDEKCNFNIILPGMDFILGTYQSEINNKNYCKKNKHNTNKIKQLCKTQPSFCDVMKHNKTKHHMC